ncbi:MAG: hypothetical protein E7589_05085 [Ruminococcaceae bacterium]|nr:hypothetical protein [Oscillospiraceae bacterium]
MFICELDLEGGALRLRTEEKRRDVKRDGICVARCTVIFPQAEGEGIYAPAAARFSDLYSSVADGFISFCVENIGKRASEEFSLSDARQRYRFFRYECVCEFSPTVIDHDGGKLLQAERVSRLCRGGKVTWESRDVFFWRLPSLLVAKDIKHP